MARSFARIFYRNAINTGWGNDVLIGAELGDILRGGPGDDRYTGNAGPDRFEIFPEHGTGAVAVGLVYVVNVT